jgi:hypothetical protein
VPLEADIYESRTTYDALNRLTELLAPDSRFAPIVTTDMWLPPALAPRRNIARPLVVPATVLLDGLEAECIGIPSELEQLSHDPRLDLST